LLDEYFPKLISGLCGHALHPLITLGFGLEFGFSSVIAEGLAYLSASYTPLGELYPSIPVDQHPLKCLDLLKSIRENPSFGNALKGYNKKEKKRGFQTRVAIVKENVGHLICDVVNSTSIGSPLAALDDISAAAVLLLTTPVSENKIDFFLLHIFTSCHAARCVFAKLPENLKEPFIRYYLQGLIYVYIAQEMPMVDSAPVFDSSNANWQSVLARAVEVTDEHIPKVVAALKQWEEHGVLHGLDENVYLGAAKLVEDLVGNGEGYSFLEQ